MYNVHVVRLPSTTAAKHPERTTTAEFHPGQDTLEVDRGHVTKNQPIKVLFLLRESLGIIITNVLVPG